jgi:uncharacterized membrane protein
MGLHKLLGSMLRNDIDFLEIFSYFIACIIVFLTLVYSMYYFVMNYEKGQETLLNIKIYISNYVSLALSVILAIEILKIYYIKTYKQLVIVSVLVLLKLVINYFLTIEIDHARELLES